MDPVTAAGIGLSIASLAMQVFSGCIKGYEMFIEIKDMPNSYQHLRLRLRIEQSRFLHWGEKVGLVEDVLEEPSKLLKWNRNLIFDILDEIQQAFRSCLAVTTKYDPHLASQSSNGRSTSVAPVSSTKSKTLQKVLSVWERSGRVAGRIEWSMLKKNAFECLISKLIHFNNRVESLLDRTALDDVHAMQTQSNVMLLHMTSKMDELRTLIEATHVSSTIETDGKSTISQATTLVDSDNESNRSLASLAVFKAHSLRIELESTPSSKMLINFENIQRQGETKYTGRQIAMLDGRRVWLEWRDTADEFSKQPQYLQQIDERVQKLAAILSARDKPTAFRSPKCIGYTRVEQGSKPRYALVNEVPDGANDGDDSFVSLRELLGPQNRVPPLNMRVDLASKLASSLLYLHAVEWVHKDIRSDNILFLRESNGKLRLSKPILAGFEFSRPALPEELTVSHNYPVEQVLYRHPDLIKGSATRSNKSHDIYSLGILLAEIALWKPVEEIVNVTVRQSSAVHVQPRMLDNQYGVPYALEERVGYKFSDAVMCCIDGSLSVGITEDEETPEVGAELARLLHEKVVQVVDSIKI